MFNMRRLMAGLLVGVACVWNAPAAFGVVQEYRGMALRDWDWLDLGEYAAEISVEHSASCPPGYGPETLRIRAGWLLGMPKGLSLERGTLLVLYRENDPAGDDADGIAMVWADYPMDIERAHNVKERRPHLWFEQDNENGLICQYLAEGGRERILWEKAGSGRITDAWNRTGWIWQKVEVDGNRVRGKFWPAHLPEPEAWDMEELFDGVRGARTGLRIWSGNISVAYAAFSTDEPPRPEPFSPWLDATLHAITGMERRLPLSLPAGSSVLATANRPPNA